MIFPLVLHQTISSLATITTNITRKSAKVDMKSFNMSLYGLLVIGLFTTKGTYKIVSNLLDVVVNHGFVVTIRV
jgi:hypothetical protein